MDERHTIEELIAILGDMINDSWSMPLSGGKVLVERDRLYEVINEIRAVLPGDIQQAKAIVQSRNELAAAARRDADAIIRAAEEKARQLVSESAVLSEAKAKSKELLQSAAAKARDTVSDAEAQSKHIVATAEGRASDLVRNAEIRSKELRTATSKFVEDALGRSDSVLQQSLVELRQVRTQFAHIPEKNGK
ncbi:MAG: hypothetical protein GX815_14765 [Clostridiales bacterium]|nr:hypothetical protein [Clostridiales bacterium]